MKQGSIHNIRQTLISFMRKIPRARVVCGRESLILVDRIEKDYSEWIEVKLGVNNEQDLDKRSWGISRSS